MNEKRTQPAEMTDERAAFEAWAASLGYNTERDRFQREMYQSTLTWELWRVWQARAILSLRPVQVPMNEWQPIETAPKDGTAVLAWDGRAQMIAFWGRSNPMNRPAWIGGHCKIDHIDQPTHWMPLPPPPKGKQ